MAVVVETDPLVQHVGGLGVGVEEEGNRHEGEAHHGACGSGWLGLGGGGGEMWDG